MTVLDRHHVHGRSLRGPFAGQSEVLFGMGCFWGAERIFWSLPGVLTTAVGYAGGSMANPGYRDVCSGRTGHAEVVRVLFDASRIALGDLLRRFWEGHDPTQGMRQGNDVGSQYRSLIACADDVCHQAALASRDAYQQRLHDAGFGTISTELLFPLPPFYFAEDEHQQYLSKHPQGYCGLGGTGVGCGLAATATSGNENAQ
ncbi:MAG: peptide-methionine (S)-S-oxide reductase [Lysobacterales bacterium CG17_big_fil_post_rev_8_21_14_2_50_64_11]|nr:MAG: peptide-methionine (S)-S-oxide reductase [Xanthomonadales bacterium CG17_big_fil_post_rev_8_21_14_2_50_64_11]PIX59214.1 MAG: peptide-methionine (S)-S-oxide reductase [Xanthomonadales bacterium CG_4_10_14_3_um_filter_64_11]